MNIRKATKQDLPQIIVLWKEFLDFHKERDPFFTRSLEGPDNFEKYMRDHLDKDDVRIYVAELNEKIVAYILAMIQPYPPVFQKKKYGLISDLAVSANYRDRGVGSDLFKTAREWFIQKGISRAEIEVAITNELAISFWKKMGFKPYKEVQYLEL